MLAEVSLLVLVLVTVVAPIATPLPLPVRPRATARDPAPAWALRLRRWLLLAFAVAASANLPAILMLLFWKRTTAKGIVASIFMGITSSLLLILFSPELYKLYGMDPTTAPVPLSNPGIISIPLSFITLVVVSLLTPRKEDAKAPSSA